MKIYKNLGAGHETYFVKMKQNKDTAYGCEIVFIDGKWEYKLNSMYYLYTLKYKAEQFPVVSDINLEEIIRRAIMDAVGVCDVERKDEKSCLREV